MILFYLSMEELNIVELIETNPITKLSNHYHGKLLIKIKESFTCFEQQLFVSSFYCYLNYNPKTDFVIDLDNVWKWLGFSQKERAKELLEKNFTIDIDYQILLSFKSEQKKGSGGHNKKKIFLTIKTFKSLCLKAGTKKADEIHDYYMKMEEMIQDIIHEESDELKLQLEQTNQKLEETHIKLEKEIISKDKEKQDLLEKTLLEQFPINTQCIYYGKIVNKTLGKPPRLHNEDLIKFGQSNNLAERVKSHKKNFTNFCLLAAFKVKNKIEIENAIKRHPILKERIRSIKVEKPNYEEENYRELLACDDEAYTIDKIHEYIIDIIKENEYNIENYHKLIDKNNALENELREKQNMIKQQEIQIEKLTNELYKYTPDITTNIQKKIASNFAICKYGYYLYAFECEPMRYKCSITRQKDFELLTNNLKELDKNGEMKYSVKVSYPFSEKIMMFLLKNNMTLLGNNKFEGSYENIKKILDISSKLEQVLIQHSDNLSYIVDLLDGLNQNNKKSEPLLDPETPQIRKSKRSIDQINKDTGEIIKTFESIEAAGRSLGLTTGTAIGIAVREKRVSQGFLWRYTGISKEDQFSDQPVIKICCKNGKKIKFETIADAAEDANISAPGLRNRILTNVHINDHHWVFDKASSHYK